MAPIRVKPPEHLAECAEADGLMTVNGECHLAYLERLRNRGAKRPKPEPVEKPPHPYAQDLQRLPKDLKVGEALSGAVKLAKATIGLNVLPDEKIAERAKVCEECPHLKLIKPKVAGYSLPLAYMGCSLCGCRYKSKIRLAHEKCPIDRWGPVDMTAETSPN